MRRRLGAGAFATVWLAYDEHLDSAVAVKVLADNWSGDDHVRERFLEEGRYLRKVESPHVVNVYDAGELDDGRPFLVMSYADQGTLADRLSLEPLTHAQAVQVVGELGAGLAALHDQQVLHRDVKPANVLFRTNRAGQVVVMLADLGLGKAMDMSSRLTMVGGTPSYAAPEQARGEHLDGRADQYSLAALAHLLLAGRPPYAHFSLADAAEPGPPPELEGVAPSVAAVVRRGLSPDRQDRYPDVRAFVAALDEAFEDESDQEQARTPFRAWMPLDPDVTMAGAGAPPPSEAAAVTSAGAAGVAAPPEALPEAPQRRTGALVAAGAAALLVGVAGGLVVQHVAVEEVSVQDASGTISVTVPRAWAEVVEDRGWTPPESDIEFAALSVGARPGWNSDGGTAGQGVFVALMPGDDIPVRIPQHPECETDRPPVNGDVAGDESITVVHTGCPGGDVTVERVVQATRNQLLWVQVRSADRATANRVLDGIELHGM